MLTELIQLVQSHNLSKDSIQSTYTQLQKHNRWISIHWIFFCWKCTTQYFQCFVVNKIINVSTSNEGDSKFYIGNIKWLSTYLERHM